MEILLLHERLSSFSKQVQTTERLLRKLLKKQGVIPRVMTTHNLANNAAPKGP